MKKLLGAIAVLSLATTAFGDILWNNYQGQDGFDGVDSLSSERNTNVTESWTVDDAVFSAQQFPLGVEVNTIRWIGVRTPGQNLFPLADLIITDASFNKIPIPNGLDQNQPYVVERIIPSTAFPNLEVYEARVAVPNIVLAPGRYYFGARLVGTFFGRNFIATTGNGVIQGQTEGYFQSDFFGFTSFTPASQTFKAGVTDFAYQIEGRPLVPEPTTLVMALGGLLFALRRR